MQVQLVGFRRMAPSERIQEMCRHSADLHRMAMDAIRHRHPNFDEHETRRMFKELTYGKNLPLPHANVCGSVHVPDAEDMF